MAACVRPCQYFTHALARAGAGLGVELVRLLHPLLSVRFDRRFHGAPGIPGKETSLFPIERETHLP